MAEVPEDLAQWFRTGSVLSDRYGMPRIRSRFRVLEVLAVLGDAENPHIVKAGAIREFATHAAADRLAKQWADEGKSVLIQTGIVLWLTEDEMPGGEEGDPPPDKQALLELAADGWEILEEHARASGWDDE